MFTSMANRFTSMTRREKIFWVFVVFVGVGLMRVLLDEQQVTDKALDDHRKCLPIINKYKSYDKLKKLPKSKAYLKGHALVINKDGKMLPYFYNPLTKKMPELESEGIGTIVIVEKEKKAVAYYEQNRKAIQLGYHVTIIDITIPAVIKQEDFWGSMPSTPKKKSVMSFWTGTDPDYKVLDYLKSLPINRVEAVNRINASK